MIVDNGNTKIEFEKVWWERDHQVLVVEALGVLASAVEDGLNHLPGFEELKPLQRVTHPHLDNGWKPAFCKYKVPLGWEMPEGLRYGGAGF